MPLEAMDFAAHVFDLDGTLIDTMPAHHRAWQRALAPFGAVFPAERFYGLAGVPASEIVPILAREQGVALDADLVIAARDRFFHDEEEETALPIERVCAIARRHRGVRPLAVASGGRRHAVDKTLRRHAMLDWFDAIVTADDVARHKPAPDVFLEAARRLGVDPRRCCAYEDGDLGIEAARAAGMFVVDVRAMEAFPAVLPPARLG
jgi:beta-phosphoglucomutase-like phosphatase (HAD superfamily)